MKIPNPKIVAFHFEEWYVDSIHIRTLNILYRGDVQCMDDIKKINNLKLENRKFYKGLKYNKIK